jgi:hypothetical protein
VYSFLLVRQFLRELSVDKEEGRSEEARAQPLYGCGSPALMADASSRPVLPPFYLYLLEGRKGTTGLLGREPTRGSFLAPTINLSSSWKR